MCLLLVRLGDVVAYRLCYVITTPLSGSPIEALVGCGRFFFTFSVTATWRLDFVSTFHPGVFNAASSLVHHSLDVFTVCVFCFQA